MANSVMADFKTLSLDQLAELQSALLAKLVGANNELQNRLGYLASLCGDMPSIGDAGDFLGKYADELDRLNKVLVSEAANLGGWRTSALKMRDCPAIPEHDEYSHVAATAATTSGYVRPLPL